MNKRIESLVSLLDDDNQQSVGFVMAELLAYGDQLPSVLREFQESDNPRLRRRIHQLETVLNFRKRRQTISESIANPQDDLFKGLIALHTQWYDNDSKQNIMPFWRAFIENSRRYHINSMEQLAYFMQKYGYRPSESNDIEADYYCLGIVLEELIGDCFIICAIAQKLAATWKIDTDIVLIDENFCIMDKNGYILCPSKAWSVYKADDNIKIEKWTASMILKLCTTKLFLCAINTDSFRYANTIGHILSRVCGSEDLSHLPMPYTSNK